MKAATMAAIASKATGTAHQRQRRRAGPPSSSEGVAGTISSVVSGLMVSLAVVVAAILAVVFLVFSDQPATERFRTSRAPSQDGGAVATTAATSGAAFRSGPPPASVLQRQLALPSLRRTSPPSPNASRPVFRPVPRHPQPSPAAEVAAAPLLLERVPFASRVRSSAALLVLLAGVGTTVALAIGALVFLAGLALRHALR